MKDSKTVPSGMSESTRSFFSLRRPKAKKPRRGGGSAFFTLRVRLILIFILVAILPLASLAYINIRTNQAALTDSARHALLTSASQTATDVMNFLYTHWYAIDDEANLPEVSSYLSLPEDERAGSQEEKEAYDVLKTLSSKQYMISYYLLDRTGKVVSTTSQRDPGTFPDFLSLNNADPYSFNLLLKTGYPFISPLMFPSEQEPASIFFAGRVENEQDETLGVLIAQLNAYGLQALLEQDAGLAGPGSFAVLFDENLVRLAHSTAPQLLFKSVVPLPQDTLTRLQTLGRMPMLPAEDLSTNYPEIKEGLDTVYTNEPYFTASGLGADDELDTGAVASLETRSWRVAYAQPQAVFLAPIRNLARNILILSLVITGLAALLALGFTEMLTRPINRLTDTAEKVAAGNLWAQAPEGRDEIGQLAKTFNMMTTELRHTLEGLEQRVAERTSELARTSQQSGHRATQLQTVAEVAHAIASVQDPDTLLQQVTHLISERFGYYHVGIFLLDKAQEFAILQAANSEGGQRMLARNHKLRVGQMGIVGYVTAHGEARIALDVGRDAVFFDNPDLPYTRSEMALPLKVGNRIIGALDVQSMEQSAFSDEDVSLLGTLAEQVAIAIENVRLFSETKSALKELQGLHRQYLQTEWTQATDDIGKTGYKFAAGRVVPLRMSEAQDDWSVVDSGEVAVVIPSGDGQGSRENENSELVVPITVRGQIIGKLNLGEPQSIQNWSDNDINLVRAVADQVGQALENARLLEQTQRRAEREHMVAEITTKLRASNDPQVILRTAAEELRGALRAKRAHIIVQPSVPTEKPKIEQGNAGNGQSQDPNSDRSPSS